MTPALAIHYSLLQPGSTGRARGVCGLWTDRFTTDPARVTCSSCQRILKNKPTNKTANTNIMKNTTRTLLTSLLLAACGPLGLDTSSTSDDDDTSTSDDGTASVEPTTGDDYTSSTGDDSTSTSTSDKTATSTSSTTSDTTSTSDTTATGDQTIGDSTGDATSTGSTSTGTSTGDDTTGGGGACYGDACALVGCADGLICATHPETLEPLCVTPCGPPHACNEVALVCGGGDPAQAECLMGFPATGLKFCFPVEPVEPEEPQQCYGLSCIENGCAPGMECVPHPDTQQPVCMTTCSELGLCANKEFACGALLPQGECVNTGTALLCVPVLCENDKDCDAVSGGGFCLDGTCFVK